MKKHGHLDTQRHRLRLTLGSKNINILYSTLAQDGIISLPLPHSMQCYKDIMAKG